jgi:predicted nucleic acid-binding protein
VFTACLDTCVLYPSLQRDFLLSLAVEGLYRPVWSGAVLTELEYVERAKLIERVGLDPVEADRRARRLIETMRGAFGDAEVEGWEPLNGVFGLPDPDDEHLVAAAVVAGAGAIVTENWRDLPQDRLPWGIERLSPQEFVANTVAVDLDRAWTAVARLADRRRNPPLTHDALLDILVDRYQLKDAVDLLRQAN